MAIPFLARLGCECAGFVSEPPHSLPCSDNPTLFPQFQQIWDAGTGRPTPSFGGINLEDIAAPDCFVIEEKLKEILDIPVFHDAPPAASVPVASDG